MYLPPQVLYSSQKKAQQTSNLLHNTNRTTSDLQLQLTTTTTIPDEQVMTRLMMLQMRLLIST